MKIRQILDKIDENQLFVPAFQREYVWKRNNAKKLIDSLIKEYPTGTMLTWETNNPPELKGKWKYDDKQGAVKILLDGQQRVTPLYFLIRNKIPPYYSKEEILTDPRGLYVNVETLELQYYKKIIMSNDPRWVNITDIFQKNIRSREVIKKLKEKDIELTNEKEDLIYDNFTLVENVLDREFLEQHIPVKARLRDAIDKINKSVKAGESLKGRKYVPIDKLPMKKLSFDDYLPYNEAKSSLISFEKNDILLGAMRVYFHRVNISPFAGVTRTTTFVLRPKKSNLLEFSLFLLYQDSTIDFANQNSRGSTMPYAVWKNSLENRPVIIPDDKTLSDFSRLLNPTIKRIRDSIFELRNLQKTRDLLLPKLMTGKIRVPL